LWPWPWSSWWPRGEREANLSPFHPLHGQDNFVSVPHRFIRLDILAMASVFEVAAVHRELDMNRDSWPFLNQTGNASGAEQTPLSQLRMGDYALGGAWMTFSSLPVACFRRAIQMTTVTLTATIGTPNVANTIVGDQSSDGKGL
jgi:hypothetical protein